MRIGRPADRPGSWRERSPRWQWRHGRDSAAMPAPGARCPPEARATAPRARCGRFRRSRARASRWWQTSQRRRPATRSWPALRTVRPDEDRATATDVVALDARPGGVAQPQRIGALYEGALLAFLDEGEAAASSIEEIRGARTVAMVEIGADQEHQAGLMIAGGHRTGVGTIGAADIIRQGNRRK